MNKINHILGSALEPVGDHVGPKIIADIVNDERKWGKGFVLALSKKWKEPERVYRTQQELIPGTVAIINVSDSRYEFGYHDLYVANIVGQHGIKTYRKSELEEFPPVRWNWIRDGLLFLAGWANANRASIHMPRIGCGNANGVWADAERVINETLIIRNIPTFVYTLPEEIHLWQ